MILGFIIRIALLMLGLAACFTVLNYFVKGSEKKARLKVSPSTSPLTAAPGTATEAAASALSSEKGDEPQEEKEKGDEPQEEKEKGDEPQEEKEKGDEPQEENRDEIEVKNAKEKKDSKKKSE